MSRPLTIEEMDVIGYDDITIDATAGGVPLTAAKLNPATGTRCRAVFFSVDGAAVRFTMDGTAPTSSVGHLLADGGSLMLHGQTALKNFRAIRSAGVSATARVTYYR